MSPQDIRREFRAHPLTERDIMVVMGLEGDLYYALTLPTGKGIDFFQKGTASASVKTPEYPLFVLEVIPETVGDGIVYKRRSAFGIDERFEVSGYTIDGLEVLVTAFKARSIELWSKAKDGHSLSQFYPYAIHSPERNSLTGILLATKAVFPVITDEIVQLEQHLQFKGRSLHGDIKGDETLNITGPGRLSESRYVTSNNEYIAFVPYVDIDPHTFHIFPKENIPFFAQLKEHQIRSLAEIMFDCIRRIYQVARLNRYFEVIYVALHSVPIIEDKSTPDRKQFVPINRAYNFHVELGPGKIPMSGYPFDIPFSGLQVNPGRPKDIAEKFRNV